MARSLALSARGRPALVRSIVMGIIGDGRWYTTTEVAQGRSHLTGLVRRCLPTLERQGLIEVDRIGRRIVFRVIYNPELFELDVLNTVDR
jgi:hypothetical protein